MLKNYLFTVLGMIVVLKIGFGMLKFVFSAKARRRSAVFYRVKRIISNWVCKPLDKVLEKQENARANHNPKIVKMPKRSQVH